LPASLRIVAGQRITSLAGWESLQNGAESQRPGRLVLLHEIGHWVHFQTSTEQLAAEPNPDDNEIFARYFARPANERESFAHRYERSTQDFLKKFGVIPFDPILG
jgi:hypothetical protein